MGGSDFHAPPPVSSFLRLFTGARFQRTDARISLVTAYSQCQARYGLGPRGVSVPLARARHGLLPTGGTKPSALTNQKFSGLNTFRVGITRYLCTSPAFVPTHRRACYQSRRKARYWARGSRLPRRDFHPLEHAALPGRTESKPGPCRRLGRSSCSLFTAWFPGGATISLPCDGSAPGSSQNRTWSVTPSGSQFESSTKGWDRGHGESWRGGTWGECTQ